MPIAKNIRYFRKKAGMTQQGFADAIGVAKSTVVSWELKKTAVPVPSAKRIARFFGVSFAELCDIDMERLDKGLYDDLNLTEQERQGILMFRKLPEDVKAIIRYTIVSTYERNAEK